MMGGGAPGYDTAAICDLFRAHGHRAPSTSTRCARRGNHYRRGVPELPASFRRLVDGDEIDIGGRPLAVLRRLRPLARAHRAAIAASSACAFPATCCCPGSAPTSASGRSSPTAIRWGGFSIRSPPSPRCPPDTLVLPSHGLPFVGAAVRVAQLHAHHAARLAELEAAAVEPRTAAEFVPVLFRRELDVQQRFFAMGEAIAHLNHLWHAGRLARIIDDDGEHPLSSRVLAFEHCKEDNHEATMTTSQNPATAKAGLRSRRSRGVVRQRRRQERQAARRIRLASCRHGRLRRLGRQRRARADQGVSRARGEDAVESRTASPRRR